MDGKLIKINYKSSFLNGCLCGVTDQENIKEVIYVFGDLELNAKNINGLWRPFETPIPMYNMKEDLDVYIFFSKGVYPGIKWEKEGNYPSEGFVLPGITIKKVNSKPRSYKSLNSSEIMKEKPIKWCIKEGRLHFSYSE